MPIALATLLQPVLAGASALPLGAHERALLRISTSRRALRVTKTNRAPAYSARHLVKVVRAVGRASDARERRWFAEVDVNDLAREHVRLRAA